MTQKEMNIIDSLIDEDERLSNDDGLEVVEELSSWNGKKKRKSIRKEIPKVCSPVVPPSDSFCKVQVNEKLLLPKLNTIRVENEHVLVKRSPVSVKAKTKSLERKFTVNELKTVEHLLLNAHEAPHRTRFRYSNVLKLKPAKTKTKERNTTAFPLSLNFPEQKLSRSNFESHKISKSQTSNNYPSSAYEKFFINLSSNKLPNPKPSFPEHITQKYRLQNLPDLPKRYLINPRSKSQKVEKFKIKKKFLLAPILQNICKYNSILK